MFIYDLFNTFYFAHYASIILSTGEYWILLLCCLGICYIPILIVKSVIYFFENSFKKSLIETMLNASDNSANSNNINSYSNYNFLEKQNPKTFFNQVTPGFWRPIPYNSNVYLLPKIQM